jgi:RNA polymerase sigma-54 factor
MELETNPLLEMDMELEEEQELESQEQSLESETDDENEDEKDLVDKEEEIDWDEILNDQEHFEPRVPKEKNPDVYERPEVNEDTLTDHLLRQLHMSNLNQKEIAIGEYIIWNIDNVGYLTMDVESIAENLEEEIDIVEHVLEVIQKFEPSGIAARNLQECLLIQLLDQKPQNDLAVQIIRDFYEDFKNKRYEKLAKLLEVDIEKVKQIIGHITKLNPKPGEGYVVFENNYIVPDIEVRYEDGEYKILMNDWNIPQLRINHQYRKMMLDKKKTSKETRDYIKQRLESARWLINSIHQRRATILRVMETIVDKQKPFFEKGPEYLKPMILKDIADEIGMDISTVSRVTNGKYVQTEWGVFELKYFFSERIKTDEGEDVSNKKIKSLIKDIVSNEPPKKPHNDQKIADMLKIQGYKVARRTVAKYREQMMIPVSRLRRRF